MIVKRNLVTIVPLITILYQKFLNFSKLFPYEKKWILY